MGNGTEMYLNGLVSRLRLIKSIADAADVPHVLHGRDYYRLADVGVLDPKGLHGVPAATA
ncbi:hypothetical protein [Candidatus Nitrososphaera sp. FF02]|uniref:hypothetical protein n=1 Tax=Candidatus Nitrososphaera sp. FF02 TaxID=3398226 RepID=UPI0039EAF6D2